MPHGGCYLWTKSLIALHAISDGLITLSYYSIPFTLIYFVRKRKDLKFHWMFICFAVFILACGTTHLMEIWNIWHASYWLSGSIKALTAAASVPTAILLVRLVPQALALPSPDALRTAYDQLEEKVQQRTADLQLEIAERKRAEVALRESEQRFRMMANAMPQLAWNARADGHVLWYNDRWYEYTGTTPEQMAGWGWQSVHDPLELPKILESWKACIATGERFDMTLPLRGADGSFRMFLTRVIPMRDAAGNVAQWFGTNTDVSELKRAEELLAERVLQRTAELEAANKELEAFSYSISHDLRAPLRAVRGFAGVVLEDFSLHLPEEGRHYLQRIRVRSQHMGALIDDLLEFSRLSRQSVNWQNVDTAGLVREVLDELKPQCDSRPMEIQFGELPTCQGDPGLLKQVWVNLLSNAIKYTIGREPAIIKIGCEREKSENIYFVRDNGAGYDMQYADKLFGVFQRLHPAESFEGTGVGLAIVQRIVHRHGGRIWGEGAVNHGATFRFTLGERNRS